MGKINQHKTSAPERKPEYVVSSKDGCVGTLRFLATSPEPRLAFVVRWWYGSLLRLALKELRNTYHRILRILRTRQPSEVLRFADIRELVPRVSCADSHNELQFCTAGILSLEMQTPYRTHPDFELFCLGFFHAERWFRHISDIQLNRDSPNNTPTNNLA
jgi:hypothetical protein